MGNRVIIIGGGAAGMAAAISGAIHGGEVILLEKNERIGKKLLATGNGRCNFTNMNMSGAYYHSAHLSMVEKLLERYSPQDIIDFFYGLGLMHRREGEGRVYPRSGQAASVLDCLRNGLDFLGVDVKTGWAVSSIEKKGQDFVIQAAEGLEITGNRVIVTTGGKANKSTGSDGLGLTLLEKMGHSAIPFYPALAKLHSREGFVKGLQGIRAVCKATAVVNGQPWRWEVGEVQFTAYGLSGIPIMQLSGLFRQKIDFVITLDFFPEYNEESLLNLLRDRQKLFSKRNNTMEDFLTGVVNKKIGQCIMKLSGIHKLSMPARELDEQRIMKLAAGLKALSFQIEKTDGFESAQVSGGGVLLGEFDENTLQSHIVPGLYCAGEVLDVYGDCGGYNLHWAWISGIIAGMSAAV